MMQLTPEGIFDASAAVALREAIGAAPGLLPTVNFGRVREFHATALAKFVEWLASSGRRIRAVGIPNHELRVLKYLGYGPERWSLDEARVECFGANARS